MPHLSKKCPELPAPPGRIALFAVIALTFGVLLAWWIERPAGPECFGTLTAQTTYVAANREGVVLEYATLEGAEVGIGDPLVRLGDASLERDIMAQEREIASLQAEVERTRAAVDLEVAWRTRALDADISEIQLRSASLLREKFDFELRRSMLADLLSGQDLVLLDSEDSLFQSMVINSKVPRSDRLATVLQLETTTNAAEVTAAQVEICEQHHTRLTDLRQQIPDQVRKSLGEDVAQTNLARAQEELDWLIAQREDLTVVSHAIGKVGVFKVRLGERLEPGTPIVDLLDDAQRYLIVDVPSHDITEFNIGTLLTLIFPGDNHRTGQVFSIAPQAAPAQQSAVSSPDSSIAVHVEQTGQVWPDVPIGSRVRVRIAARN